MNALWLREDVIHSSVEMILFDKDGTLIDIHHYWASIIKLRAQKIAAKLGLAEATATSLVDAMGVDLLSGRMKPEGPVGIKPRAFIVKVVVKTLELRATHVTEAWVEEIFKEVDAETASDLSPYVHLLPGVARFLGRCHELGVRLAVATTDLTSRADTALTTLGIRKYFEQIVGGDKVSAHKPAPDAGQLILKASAVDAARAVMIGDHPVDVEMGIKTAIPCNVGVLTGLGTSEDFRPYACFLAGSFEELDIKPC